MCTASKHQYRVLLARPYGSSAAFRPEVFPVVFGGGLLMGGGGLHSGIHDNIVIWLTRDGHSQQLATKCNGVITIVEAAPIKVRVSERGSFVVDDRCVGLQDGDSLDILPLGDKPFCSR